MSMKAFVVVYKCGTETPLAIPIDDITEISPYYLPDLPGSFHPNQACLISTAYGRYVMRWDKGEERCTLRQAKSGECCATEDLLVAIDILARRQQTSGQRHEVANIHQTLQSYSEAHPDELPRRFLLRLEAAGFNTVADVVSEANLFKYRNVGAKTRLFANRLKKKFLG